MPRYVVSYKITGNINEAYSFIHQYLLSEGYEFVNFEGENVFKKGHGLATGPTFFKFTVNANFIAMETWMKYAVLPGVYAGELGTTGFVGCAAKGPWKNRIEYIEGMLSRYGVLYGAPQNVEVVQPVANPQYQSGAYSSANFGSGNCPNCNSPLVAGAEFCMSCGNKIPKTETCKNCGAPLVHEAEFCTKCGQKVVKAVSCCPDCGAEILAGSIFCSKCGRRL